MGDPLKHVSPTLRRKGQAGRYRCFPIRREAGDEYHVFMGFPTQGEAEKWIDSGLANGLLRQPELKKGPPKKP